MEKIIHVKKKFMIIALADEKVSIEAKKWLKTLRELVTANRHLLQIRREGK
jgi:hypothetical protein